LGSEVIITFLVYHFLDLLIFGSLEPGFDRSFHSLDQSSCVAQSGADYMDEQIAEPEGKAQEEINLEKTLLIQQDDD